jgi:hypothetical protein
MYHWDGSKWVLDTEEPSFYISGTPAQTFNSGTPTVLTGSSTAITNLGQAKLLMTLTLLGTNQFVTTNNCAVYIDGVQQHIFATGAVTLISQPITDLAALAAATHTVDVRIWGTGGGSVTVSAFTLLWRVVRG